jgi:GntR family transcriptional regulator, transcriptional repressor for pyruvate dehydrogenase complex
MPRRPAPTTPQEAVTVLKSRAVAAIRRTSAVDTVKARIALAVEHGLLVPGERLPGVSEIAAGLEVGEITVRRALEELERAGVVDRRRGRNGGTYISGAPPKDAVTQVSAYREDEQRVRRLIDERAVLDVGLAQRACIRRTDRDLAVLRDCVDQMAAVQDWAEFHVLDERFHVAIATAADMPAAMHLYCSTLTDLYAYFLPYPIAYLRASNVEHERILAGLAARDVAATADAVYEHVIALHRTMYIGLTKESSVPTGGSGGSPHAITAQPLTPRRNR